MRWPGWKEVRRYAVRGAKVLVGAMCVLVVAQALVLPWVVRRVVSSALQSLGVENARFEVRGVSLFRADLADLSIGEERLAEVGNITADFSPATLVRGRVKTIAITGAEVELALREGRIDLRALKLGRRETTATTPRGVTADLPFDQLELRASSLAVQLEERRLNVPVGGRVINRRDDGTASFELEARLQGAPVDIRGTIGPASGQYSVNVVARSIGARALVALLPRETVTGLPTVSGGTLAVTVSHSAGAGGMGTRVHLATQQLRLDHEVAGERIGVDDLAAVVDGRWDQNATLAELKLDGSIARLWVGRESFQAVDVTARKVGEGFSFALKSAQLLGEGTYEPRSGQLEVSAEVKALQARRLLSFVPPEKASQAPVIRGGTVSARIVHRSIHPSPGRTAIELSGQLLALDWARGRHHVNTTGLAFAAAAVFEGAPDPDELKVTATAERLAVDDEVIEGLNVTLERRRSGLLVSASGTGNDWAVQALEGRFSGVFPVRQAPVPDRREVEGTITILANGRLPANAIRALFAQRINATRVGQFSIEGTIKAAAVFELPLVMNPGEPLPIDWKVNSENLRIALAPGDLTLARGEVELGGLSMDMPLAVEGNAERVMVALRPGGRIELGSVALRDGSIKVGEAAGGGSLAVVAIEEAGLVSFSPLQAAETWRLELPSAVVGVTTGVVESEQWRIEGLSGALKLRGVVDSDQVELHALAGSDLRLGAGGAGGIRSSAASFTIAPYPGEALLLAAAGIPPTVAAVVSSDGPVEVAGADVVAKVARVEARGLLVPGTLQSVVSLADGSVLMKEGDARVTDITATVPISFNAGGVDVGEFVTGPVRMGRHSYPPARGRLALRDGELVARADWPVLENLAALAVDARLNITDRSGQVKAVVPTFEVADEKALARLVPGLAGLDVSGQFGAEAVFELHGDRVVPRVEVVAKNVTVGSKEYVRALEGLSGKIVIDSLDPLTTPGAQRIEVAATTLGKLKLTEGRMLFRLEPDGRLHVEETSWGMGGGRLYTNSFRFNPARPELDLTVTVDRIGLQGFLPAVSDGAVTGEGAVYGRIPVKVQWPIGERKAVDWSEAQLAFGEGFVYATPGGGRLSVENPQELLGEVLEKQDKRFARGGDFEPIKQRLMTALRDLNYSILRLDLVRGEGESLTARLHLAGKARQGGPNAPEIGGITININHFDEVLKRAVWIQKRLSIGK